MHPWNANDGDYPWCSNKTNAKFTAWYKCIIAYYSCCEPGRHRETLCKSIHFSPFVTGSTIYMFAESERRANTLHTPNYDIFQRDRTHTAHEKKKKSHITIFADPASAYGRLHLFAIVQSITTFRVGTAQFRLGSFNWNFLKWIDSVFNHSNLSCFLRSFIFQIKIDAFPSSRCDRNQSEAKDRGST